MEKTYYTALASSTRQQVLSILLEADRPLDAAAIAEGIDLHLTTVRFHLEQLEHAGLVRRQPDRQRRRGRPRILYSAAPVARAERSQRELLDHLAEALSGTPGGGVPLSVEVGRRWAGRVVGDATKHGADPLIGVLDRLGFDPQPEDDGIHLLSCPFRAAASKHPEVICGVHRGLVEGAVESAGGDGSSARLLPFVQPHLCTVVVPGGSGSCNVQEASA